VTATAAALLAVAAVFALGDWVAVAEASARLEYLCKPAVTAALVVAAITVDPVHADTRGWFVAALTLCLAGDVWLMLPPGARGHDWFVPGLASFLLAQLAFAIGFALHGGSAGSYALGAVLVLGVAVPLATRFVRALVQGGQRALIGPVLAYLLAIAAMATSAVAAANAWGVAGAALFLASDALIAETRFVGPRHGAPVAIMVTYHLALAGLVASLAF
jgi:alkenylglycerophosphocholine/alkenylglycerophosphoethanolamine hydrolase